MKKTEKTKTDPLGWILAFLFPKKSKPAPVQKKEPVGITKAPQTETVTAAPVTAPPQVYHPVTAPPPTPAPPQVSAPVNAPAGDKSTLVQTTPKTTPANTAPGKGLRTFWTIASVLSLVVNVILIIVLVVLANQLFVLKALVGDQLLGGLYENFIYMDLAHIKTNITVQDSIPINFTLPISQDTVVVLTENTPINGANVRINSGGLTINSAANIVLPAGTHLPVHLELNVPVNTNVPIKINVPVDIPLQQTELHKPFIGLQQVVSPFYNLLQPQIKSPDDVGLCKPLSLFCNFFFAH